MVSSTTSREVLSGCISTKDIPACKIIHAPTSAESNETEPMKCSTGIANAIEWNGLELNGMEWNRWCGMVWCGMVWCGVEWYGMHSINTMHTAGRLQRKVKSTLVRSDGHLVYSFLLWCGLPKRGKNTHLCMQTFNDGWTDVWERKAESTNPEEDRKHKDNCAPAPITTKLLYESGSCLE